MNLGTVPFAISLFLVATSFLLRGEDTPDAPAKDKDERAFDLVEAADFVVEIADDGNFDIGVGRLSSVEDGEMRSRKRIYFEREELTRFFDQQRHKNLTVLIFHKSSRGLDEINAEVVKLNSYFKDRGYKRIVIQQYLAFSRPILSDITVTP